MLAAMRAQRLNNFYCVCDNVYGLVDTKYKQLGVVTYVSSQSPTNTTC